uniref:Uncharacterized protein n=1 Tax=Cannabis sativa TaxID=3483 RepID=A0A803NVV7_CANSA
MTLKRKTKRGHYERFVGKVENFGEEKLPGDISSLKDLDSGVTLEAANRGHTAKGKSGGLALLWKEPFEVEVKSFRCPILMRWLRMGWVLLEIHGVLWKSGSGRRKN